MDLNAIMRELRTAAAIYYRLADFHDTEDRKIHAARYAFVGDVPFVSRMADLRERAMECMRLVYQIESTIQQ